MFFPNFLVNLNVRIMMKKPLQSANLNLKKKKN